MMGTKIRSFSPLPDDVSLEDLVPKDHFYRRLEAALDLSCPGSGTTSGFFFLRTNNDVGSSLSSLPLQQHNLGWACSSGR